MTCSRRVTTVVPMTTDAYPGHVELFDRAAAVDPSASGRMSLMDRSSQESTHKYEVVLFVRNVIRHIGRGADMPEARRNLADIIARAT